MSGLTELERELLGALKATLAQLETVLPASGLVHDERQALIAAKAAIARAEAKVKGSKPESCVCDPATWNGTPNSVCGDFTPSDMVNAWCHTCGHDLACHSSAVEG